MKNKLFSGILIFLVLNVAFASADVVINEIMYIPSGTDSGHEWIEIYNNGPDIIDINEWKLFEDGTNHGISRIIGSNSLAVGDYAVITSNDVNFLVDYPSFSGNLFDSAFSLSNTGEELALNDELGNQKDSVTYSNSWGNDAEGFSLELINNKYDNALKDNWGSSTVVDGTPGAINSIFVDNDVPEITDLTVTPQNPAPSDDVEICATVTDASEINSVTLAWDNHEGKSTPGWDMDYSNENYCLTLSTASTTPHDGTTVTYSITATDSNVNADTTDDAEFTYYINDAPVVAGIQDQTIEEGQTFTTFDLDTYLTEVDGETVLWTYSGNNELTVSIDNDHVATITIPNENWNGAETITFTATDNNADALSDSDEAVFTVTAVNDLPTSADKTVETNEDTNYTFLTDDFAFNDVDDSDSLASVKITTLETVGALQLSGADVTLNQVITVADITAGNLVFVPVANANGAAYDTFDFSVNDGTVDSAASYTMTIDVTAVNDAPSFISTIIQAIEDILKSIGVADVAEDVERDSLTFDSIDTQPEHGSAQIDPDSGEIEYTPEENYAGSDSMRVTVSDGEASTTGDIQIAVTPVNDLPTSTDNTVTTDEDTNYTFLTDDFAFNDVDDGDSLASVKITTLETVGALQLSRADVTLNQVIAIADITAGKLVFVPALNANGAGYATFKFKVNDGTTDSAASYTMTINVNGVNDLPTSADKTVTTDEDANYTFLSADFNFNDVDGNSLSSVKITTLESNGSLKLSRTDVTLNQVIAIADITDGKLVFVPALNANGADYATFKFKVNDGTTDSAASYTMTINVNGVNDVPVITSTIAEQEATEGLEFSWDITATDVDDEQAALSISPTGLPDWLSVEQLTISGTPENEDVGVTEITLRVTDGTGNSEPANFNITVKPALELTETLVNGEEVSEDGINTTVGEQLTVNFKFKNNYDRILGHVGTAANVVMLDADDNIVISEDDFVDHAGTCTGTNCDEGYWALAPSASGTDSFTFEVPLDYAEDTFDVMIIAEYDDFWSQFFPWLDTEYLAGEIITFNVIREEVDLQLENVSLEDETLTCTKFVNLELELINTGEQPVAPELLIYDKEPVESSFNSVTGKFTSFTGGEPTIKQFETTGEIDGSATEDVTLNLSALNAGEHRLYIYVVNPYYDGTEKFVADSTTVTVTTGSCLNVSGIESALATGKNSQEAKQIDLLETDEEGNYLYLLEDMDYEDSLEFEIATDEEGEELQSNSNLIICEIIDTTLDDGVTVHPFLSCTAPTGGQDGTSAVTLLIAAGYSETTESFTVTVNQTLTVTNVKVNNVAVEEGNKTTNLKPNEEVTVEFTVTNHLDHAVTGVTGKVQSDILTVQTENSAKFNLAAGASRQVTLTKTLPHTVTAAEYAAALWVEGRDYNDNTLTQADKYEFILNVAQEPADVAVSKLTVADANGFACKAGTTLAVELTNKGKMNENDLYLTVKGTNWDWKYDSDPTTAEVIDPITLNSNSQATYTVNIPAENLSRGANTLTAEIKYRDNFNTNQKTVTVTKNSCLSNFEPSEDSLVLPDGLEQEFNVSLAETGFTDSIAWEVKKGDTVVDTTSGTETYTFVQTAAGEYKVKASVGGETKTWTVMVTNKPVSRNFQTNLPETVTETQMAAFPNFTVDKTNVGKIAWTQPVDLTNTFNLDEIISITGDTVTVDVTKAPELNKPAKITLKKMFSNHVILYNGSGTYQECTEPRCKVISNGGGEFVFTVTGFSSYKVMEKVSAGLTISDISFTDVNRGDNVSITITVKNTGSLDPLTGLNAELVGVNNNEYGADLGTLPTTLGPGAEARINLSLNIPDDESAGRHSIGKVKVSSNELNPVETNIYVNPKSFLAINSVKINDKTAGKLAVDDVNSIEVEVKNEYTKDLENVEVLVELLDVDGEDLEEEGEIGDLREGKDDSATVELDLSGEDIDEDEYTLRITVTGEAEDGTEHETVEENTVKIDLESHDVRITKASLGSEKVICARNNQVQVTIKNFGKSDEDEIDVTVKNSALGLDLSRGNLELDNYFDKDNSQELSLSFDSEDAEAGTYTITVEVSRDGKVEDSKDLTLTVEECATTTTSSQSQTSYSSNADLAEQLHQQLLQQQATNVQRQQVPPATTTVKTTFRDSTAYLALLGLLAILLFVAVVLGLAVAVVSKKRRH